MDISYGQTVGAIKLKDGIASTMTKNNVGSDDDVDGLFEWEDENLVPSSAGICETTINFTPDNKFESGNMFDQDDPSSNVGYMESTTKVSINVKKAVTRTKELPEVGPVFEGETLNVSVLNGGTATSTITGEEVPGTWKWQNPKEIFDNDDLSSTDYFVSAAAVFTPDETDKYESFTTEIPVKVMPFERQGGYYKVTAPNTQTIHYGQLVTTGSLYGGEVLYGSDVEQSDGGHEFVSIEVPGKWYVDISDSIHLLDAGTQGVGVTFIADKNLAPGIKNKNAIAMITVNPAILTNYIIPEIAGPQYGEKLSEAVLSGGSVKFTADYIGAPTENIEGKWQFENQNMKLPVGETDVNLLFIPSGEKAGNFEKIVTSVAINVGKAKTEIASNPQAEHAVLVSAAGVTERAYLSSTAIIGGEVRYKDHIIPGQWSWDEPDTTWNTAGTYIASATFVPLDNDNYNTVKTDISVTVKDILTTVIAAPASKAMYVGISLGAIGNPTGGTVTTVGENAMTVTGSFVWADPDLIPVQIGTWSALAISEPDNMFGSGNLDGYVPTATMVAINVSKASLSLDEELTATSIYYGQPIDKSSLSGGTVISDVTKEKVKGSWEWVTDEDNTITSGSVGINTFSAVFTPDRDDLYDVLVTDVSITVKKHDSDSPYLKYYLPHNAVSEYGQYITDDLISSGAVLIIVKITEGGIETEWQFEVEGKWTFDVKNAIPDAPTTTMAVSFQPSDEYEEYIDIIHDHVKITIEPTGPKEYSLPEAGDIYYGQKLTDSAITQGAVTFTAIDNTQYNVEGKWAFDDYFLMPEAGIYEKYMTFTPSGDKQANYLPITTKVSITVLGVEPVINEAPTTDKIMPEQEPAVSAQYLTSSSISGGRTSYMGDNVTGVWQWENISTAVSFADSGSYTASAVFIPDDTKNYLPVTTGIAIDVLDPVTYVSDLPTAGSIFAGQTLGAIDTPVEGTVRTDSETEIPGKFIWTDINAEPTKSGIYITGTTFIPDNHFDPQASQPESGYFTCTTDIAISVAKADLEVVDSPDASLSYGETLGAAQISQEYKVVDTITNSDVTGNWEFKDKADVSGTPGTYNESAVFYPDKNETYSTCEAIVSVDVTKAVTGRGGYEFENPKASDIKYEQKTGDSKITGKVTFKGKTVAGNWTFSNPDEEPDVGDYELPVVFKPTGSDAWLYSDIQSKTSLHVKKAGWENDDDSFIDFLGELIDLIIDKDTYDIYQFAKKIKKIYDLYKKGKFSKTDAIKLALKVVRNLATKIKQIIDKYNQQYDYQYNGKPYLQPSTVFYGTAITDDMVKGPDVYLSNKKLSGSWEYCIEPTLSPEIPTVLHTMVLAEFNPSSKNYTSIIEYVDINVEPAPLNKYSEYTLPEVVDPEPGKKLSELTLSGGSLTFKGEDMEKKLNGVWSFADPGYSLEPLENKVSIIFEPDGEDTFNYENLITEITIDVPKATGIVADTPQADRAIVSMKEYDSPRQYLTSAAIVGTVTFNNRVIEGSWSWNISDDTKVRFEEPGEFISSALFTPDDLDSYNTITTDATFTVYDRYTEIVEIPTTQSIYYGESLSPSAVLADGKAISENDEIHGIFKWLRPDTVPSATGTIKYPVIFIPDNMFDLDDPQSDGYAPSATMVAVEVKNAPTAAAEAPETESISYGESFDDVLLSGGAVVSSITGKEVTGIWGIPHGEMIPTSTGIITTEAIFTPDRSDLYTKTVTEVSIAVTQAVPGQGGYEYSLPDYEDSIYGAYLDSKKLKHGIVSFGSITVSGVWTLDNAGDMPVANATNSGFSIQNVTFTPDVPVDSSESMYGMIEDFITIKFNRAGLSQDTDGDGIYDTGGGGDGQIYEYKAPDIQDISYGDELGNNLLTSGAVTFGSISVSGIWEFTDPYCDPDTKTTSVSVKFSAGGNWKYNLEDIQTVVPINVTSAALTEYTLPEVSDIEYMESLGDVNVTGGTVVFAKYTESVDVKGKWTLDDPGAVPEAGTTYASITFNPTGDDKDNYMPVTTKIAVTINKASGDILTEPKADHGLLTEQEPAVSLQYLTSAALIGGNVTYRDEYVDGQWKWAAETSVSYRYPGVYTQSAVFTPDDLNNYEIIFTTVDVTVYNLVTSIEETPTGNDLYYGQTLSKSGTPQGGRASAGHIDNVTGSFIWLNPNLITPGTGKWDVAVKFQPEDVFDPEYPELGGYVPCFTTTAITVHKAPVSISKDPEAGSVAYGEKISESILSGGAVKSRVTGEEVKGNWSWIDTVATGSAIGYTTAEAIFIPGDTNNFSSISAILTLKIDQAQPDRGGYEYQAPTVPDMTFGALLNDKLFEGGSVTFGGMSVSGQWMFSDPEKIPYSENSNGNAEVKIVFIPDTPADKKISPYGTIDDTVSIKINKASPSFDSDGDGEYDAGGGGNGQLYICEEAPDVDPFIYGNAPDNEMLGGGMVSFDENQIAGEWLFDEDNIAVFDPTQTTAKAIFTPDDPMLYNLETIETIVNLHSAKGTSVQIKPSSNKITYGQAPVDGGNPTGGVAVDDDGIVVDGTFEWVSPNMKPFNPGTYTREVKFIPDDMFDVSSPDAFGYLPSYTTASVIVDKAVPVIKTKPAASGLKYGDSLSKSTLKGGNAQGIYIENGETIQGIFAWKNPGEVQKTSGNVQKTVIFTPTGSVKYKSVEFNVTVNVGKKPVANVTKLYSPNKTIYLKKGKSRTLPLGVNATDSLDPKLKWTSSKTKVATVNKSGKIKAKKKGTTKITVKSENGKKYTFTVKVVKKSKKVKKFSVKGYKKKMKKGQVKYLTVKLNPKSATNGKITFKSSKKSVIAVNKAGKLTAKKKGTAKITVKAGKKKKVIKIKVK